MPARKAKQHKKPTIKELYYKEREKLRRRIKAAEGRGYDVPADLLPPIPKRITRGSIRKLQAITPKKMYEKSRYGGEATGGEVVPGLVGRKAERSEAAKKGAETRRRKKERKEPERWEIPEVPEPEEKAPYEWIPEEPEAPEEPERPERPDSVSDDTSFFDEAVITGYLNDIMNDYYDSPVGQQIYSWIMRIIDQYGRHETAVMLNDGAANGTILTKQIAYNEGMLYEYFSDMLDYLPGATDEFKADLMDSLEQSENWEFPE